MSCVELNTYYKGQLMNSNLIDGRELAVQIIEEVLCPPDWVKGLIFSHPENQCEQIFVDGRRLMWTIRDVHPVIRSVEEFKGLPEERNG
jgi:hypothetical protein